MMLIEKARRHQSHELTRTKTSALHRWRFLFPLLAAIVGAPNAAHSLELDGKQFTFRMIGVPSPQLKQYTEVEKPYFGTSGEVERESNGRINFILSTDAEMGIRDADNIDLLSRGTVDIAQVHLQQAIGRKLPIAFGADLPGLYSSFDEAEKAMELFQPELSKYTEKYLGIKLLGHFAYGGSVLFCNSPVNSVADLKGKRIRTSGGYIGDIIDRLGGVNVALAFAEVYSAAQQGVVDCVVTDASSGNSARFWEVTKHLYDLPLAIGFSAYGINLNVWDSLPADVQDYLVKTFNEVTQRHRDLTGRLSAEGIACNTGDAKHCPPGAGVLAERPMTYTKAGVDDTTEVQDILVKAIIPNWLSRCDSSLTPATICRSSFNNTIGKAVGLTIPD